MFAAGGSLVVKQTLANITRKDPEIRVRVQFTSGRLVHTDKGVFHYGELEVPRQKERFVSRLPYTPGVDPRKVAFS
jgi:hypothetical protein